jgi:tripartite-type tricarboxylate transporter receptor subunit TctC
MGHASFEQCRRPRVVGAFQRDNSHARAISGSGKAHHPSAGGSNDIVSRAIGQKLREAWQLPVIVDNQVGASGSSGAARVARSAPDGYTLLILSSTYTINSAVMANLPFDPKASFASVAMLGKAPMMLAASKTLPARNAKELIALTCAKPGELNYGSAGVGSINHMAMELLKSLGGFDIKHVPYRAGNAAVNDLVGAISICSLAACRR